LPVARTPHGKTLRVTTSVGSMKRRTRTAALLWVSVGVVVVGGVIGVAGALGAFALQVPVTVVNDLHERVDLTCLSDNRNGVRPGHEVVLPVDSGSTEDCEVDGHGDLGCLVLDAHGQLAAPHEIRISEARRDRGPDCSV
jgi:hypothetical protein